ncbi:PREDICTED: probably inactive leucine-rich repeat receptor-like protein kinase At3g28040 [Nelumbo nucifera]|uniref:non-specific serine/threonine protein kinase n=2 Tax=Nelumbo nucifera TaxID=4432 RepID=A0A1U8AY63_NELNU|nr:PREDICTED: probably inactive leucine-rich repeat receptor-like protein kinase At3g28040 [Nelumbo nucifera]
MKVDVGFLLLRLLLVLMASSRRCMGDSNSEVSLQLNDDVLGLIVFKTDLHDPSSLLGSWNEDDNTPCSWKYVRCDPSSGRVTELSLDGLGLSGKIGRGLEKLQNLQVLSLSHNNFTGDISPELSLIGSLTTLNLSHNSLSGRIPVELGNMSALRFLDLSENSLSGPLPDGLFQNCFSLHFFSSAWNILEGPVPATLSRCTSLVGLNLSNNHFSGNPDFVNGVWSLKNLRSLDISRNAFSGSVPDGISALDNLKNLQFQGNHFSGPIPADLGLCQHLTHLDLSNNLFTGALPESLQRLSLLRFLSLSDNLFSGDFPWWISNMSSLEYLDFSGNSFTGNLPATMDQLKLLSYLSLSGNRLTGGVPATLAYCYRLSAIRLRGNGFNGSIPQGLFDLGLEEIDLSRNEFSGSIPAGSSRLFESLRALDLSANKLTGDIPAEMGLFSNLRYLNLSWNSLRSRLPPELGYFQNLSVLDLRNSALYGSIPEDLCDSTSLAILQLDGNSLTGPIPDEIGNCSSLYLLSLSNNQLNGSIPKAMSRLKKLKILKLEFNELSGEIPQELGKLDNLLAVNISYNKLVGRLPVGGIFQNLDQSALQGNLGICSPLLRGPCKMNVPKPLVLDPNAYNNQMGGPNVVPESTGSAKLRHRRFLSVSAIVAISAALVIVCGVVIVSLLNVSARRRLAFVDNALESMCSSSQRSGSLATGKLILFDSRSSDDWAQNAETLLNKASEIGKGVFGTVYKASLGEGRIVAIKKLVTSNIIQYPEDFDREVRILGKARHPNLITLKGYFWTPQLQLLISEYAPNGSLHSRLHERSPSSPPLSWANRFKIALGTAKGLVHLHQNFRPPIIHYSIKPSNILLDENYNPKISDFGLARLLTKLDKHVISSRFQSALGYVAPELACQSLRINEKCDIYGFGVMILELVTGRKPVEYGEDDVVILSDHVRVMLEQGKVLSCVDPTMGEYPEEEVLPVLKLGLVCTSQIPSSRPSMAEVVQILQVIKTPVPQRMEAF